LELIEDFTAVIDGRPTPWFVGYSVEYARAQLVELGDQG